MSEEKVAKVPVDLDDHSAEPWCPEHGYGCEPQDCPCGHTLRCDCRDIALWER